ncbi:MAG: type II-A CRISPR-associated protein Csn2 [Erysipelotrichia bacterium]|nr:type II-A CRISPR-associated protein Csn2 [Erysipelotrichia bacterium]
MKVSINGIDQQLCIQEPGVGLLNVHNKQLYRSTCRFLRTKLDESDYNDIVFFEDNERINSKEILYIQDIDLYSFDTKQIVERIVKSYIAELHESVIEKNKETERYRSLIQPVLQSLNLLEVDYDYKEELDSSMYYKMLGIVIEPDEEMPIVERMKSIINVESKIFRKKFYIINHVLPMLTGSEITELNKYVNTSNCYLLFVDYLADSDVVVTNNLIVDEDYGVYSIH